MSLDITAVDFFCGAGGSSTGIAATGVQVKTAVNHWNLAIQTHATNHPNTDHDCVDIRTVHPGAYPRTNIAWFSPECTNHSVAKGKKRKSINQLDLWGETQVDPSEERSRATMREVVEFAAYHRHEIVIVENVVDIRYWQHFDQWLTEMINLGYDYRILYLNAEFFGVAQSRDRFYAVFWRKGNKPPDLDFRPPAVCAKHGQVNAVQAWKKPEFPWGRYGARRQYVYRCPTCGSEVKPPHTPAWTVIDWRIPAPLIGERERPLKPKTTQRILAGLEKFASRGFAVDTAFTHGGNGYTTDFEQPLPTQTTRQTLAAVFPFIYNYFNTAASGIDDSLGTITTIERQGLVIPPFIAELWGASDVREIEAALATITAGGVNHGLVVPPYLVVMKNSSSPDGRYTMPPLSMDDPLTTIVASTSQHALIVPPFTVSPNHSDVERSKEVHEPFDTIMPNALRALVIPPFMVNYYNNEAPARNVDDPMYTVATRNTPALVVPFLMSYYGRSDAQSSVNDAMPVIPTENRHSLVIPSADMTPEQMLPYCGFRMLEPHELKLGMSFPSDYVILGNKRDQVKQIGNAVCVNVARWIVERCVQSLQ